MLTTKEAYLMGRDHLRAAGVVEPAIEAEMLLRLVLGLDRAQLYTRWDNGIPEEAWDRYRARLDERTGGRPVHYIVGEREFMGLSFAIDERVLIPRPDTELLVEYVAGWIRDHGGSLVVDVGTGSGCIAVTLAHLLPNVTVHATDLSGDALDVARANAARHGVEARIHFAQGDLLSPLPANLAGRFDVIAGNPPYVPRDQAFLLSKEITEFEPSQAIFVPGDGTELHDRMIEMAPRWLCPGGLLAMEVGAGQAPTVGAALERAGGFDNISLIPDSLGIERVVSATRL